MSRRTETNAKISASMKGNLNRKGGNARFITQALILELNDICTDPNDPKSNVKDKKVRWMVKMLVKLALLGDTTCLKMVMDRVEGQATQAIAFTETPEHEAERMTYTRQQLEKMTPEQRNSLYLATLRETTRTHGSA